MWEGQHRGKGGSAQEGGSAVWGWWGALKVKASAYFSHTAHFTRTLHLYFPGRELQKTLRRFAPNYIGDLREEELHVPENGDACRWVSHLWTELQRDKHKPHELTTVATNTSI